MISVKDLTKCLSLTVSAGLLVAYQALPARAGGDAFLVVPGHRLGPVRLGSNKKAVHRVMGLPYLRRSNGGLKTEYFHASQSDEDHYVSVIYESGRVVQIETDAPRFRTAQGLTAASTLGQIRRRLGRLRIVSFGQGDPDPDAAEHAQHFYDDAHHGLAFELDLGDRADTSPEVVPAGIIVHPAGHPVSAPE